MFYQNILKKESYYEGLWNNNFMSKRETWKRGRIKKVQYNDDKLIFLYPKYIANVSVYLNWGTKKYGNFRIIEYGTRIWKKMKGEIKNKTWIRPKGIMIFPIYPVALYFYVNRKDKSIIINTL